MASQQGAPARPWFRLATMVRPTPAAPTPQPDQPPPAPSAPRPPFIRPAFSQTFRVPPAAPPPPPPSPPTPPPPPAAAAAASPPKPLVSLSTTVPQEPRPMPSPQSPPPPPTRSIPPSLTTTTTRAATPTSSPPKTVKPLEKTPPPSPTIKPISHPPSPLTLPSPQLNSNHRNHPEYEQKAVLVQETKQKPKAPDNAFNGEIPKHMGWTAYNPKTDAAKKPQTFKKSSDSEDSGMRIITIAGENKGAVMDLSSFPNKTHMFGNNPHSLNIKKENPTASSDGNKSGTDSDGRSKAKKKNQKSASQLMTAFMNSNVQGVNNSILYNSSTTHHDPGVHLSLSRKPNGSRGFHIKDHKDRIN